MTWSACEITYIANYFARQHDEQITRDVGIDPRALEVDLEGVKASVGLPTESQRITARELQERRELIRRRMTDRRRRR